MSGLLFMVITFAESKLCGSALSLQLILQLRNKKKKKLTANIPPPTLSKISAQYKKTKIKIN